MASAYEMVESYAGTRYDVSGSVLYRKFVLTVDAEADDPEVSFASATGGFPLYTGHHKRAGFYAREFVPEPTADPLTYYMQIVYVPSTLLPNSEWDIEWGWAYETTKKLVTDDGVTIGPHAYVKQSTVAELAKRNTENPDSLTAEEGALLVAVGVTSHGDIPEAKHWTEVRGVRIWLYQLGGDIGRRVIGIDVPKELFAITFRTRTGLLGRTSPRDILNAGWKVNAYPFQGFDARTVMCQPPRIKRTAQVTEGVPTQGFTYDVEIPFVVNQGGWTETLYDQWEDENGDTTFIYGNDLPLSDPQFSGFDRVYTKYRRGSEVDFDALLAAILPPSSKVPGQDGKGGGR